jgi:hypothetical protein
MGDYLCLPFRRLSTQVLHEQDIKILKKRVAYTEIQNLMVIEKHNILNKCDAHWAITM